MGDVVRPSDACIIRLPPSKMLVAMGFLNDLDWAPWDGIFQLLMSASKPKSFSSSTFGQKPSPSLLQVGHRGREWEPAPARALVPFPFNASSFARYSYSPKAVAHLPRFPLLQHAESYSIRIRDGSFLREVITTSDTSSSYH